MKKIYLLILIFFYFNCQSTSSYIINIESEDVKLSSVSVSDVLLSTTEMRVQDNQRQMIFKKWIFTNADKTHVFLRYEESIGVRKSAPDVAEVKSIPIVDGSITLSGYRIVIFQLKEDFMAYTLKTLKKQ